jgi:hypothetical protein
MRMVILYSLENDQSFVRFMLRIKGNLSMVGWPSSDQIQAGAITLSRLR